VVTRTAVSTGQQQPTHSDTVVRLGAVEATHRTEVQATWAISDGEVRASTTATGAMLQAVAEVQLDTLRLAEVLAGPGTAHLEVHRLHFPALTSLLREVMELWQDEPDFSALWLRLQWSGDLARQLAGLAGSQPEIALTRMRLQTTDGVVQATLRLRLDGNRLLVPGYFPQLGQAIDAAIDGEAPASWVRAVIIAQVRQAMRARSQLAARTPTTVLNTLAATITDLQLRRLVAQKYLLLDGNMYRSQARYIRGRLLVNGKPLDLAALVQ